MLTASEGVFDYSSTGTAVFDGFSVVLLWVFFSKSADPRKEKQKY
jgi:hypothetical protein